MPNAYFVVSDLHLCDLEDHEDGWKAYKAARYVADRELAAAWEAFLARNEDARCTMVLNGDIFDFDLVTHVPDDAPWPVRQAERRRGLDATEAKSEWKLARVLADHPVFVDMLARALARGHRVVYVMGNHDREMCFEAVQQRLRDAVETRSKSEGLTLRGALELEPWFFYVPGEIYVEHGQQYDYYNSFRYVLRPTIPGSKDPAIALPMGNLSNRELMSEMGFFNPHASDYILNIYSYVVHWLRHYAFSTRRHIATRWFLGSIIVLFELLRTKSAVQRNPPDHERALEEMATRIEMPVETLRALDALKRQPITTRWYRVVREFWIDRLILAALMTGGTITLALVPIPLWIKLMVPLSSFPLLYLIYEWFAHGETVFSAGDQAATHALRIARIVPTRVVTFGHSHKPMLLPIDDSVSYVNTGTWAPVWGRGEENHELALGLCNVLEARFDDDRPPEISLTSHPRRSRSDAPAKLQSSSP